MRIKNLFVFMIVLMLFACTPAPRPTLEFNGIPYYPLNTRTGMDTIDSVLAAVESGDVELLRELFSYTITKCLTVEGLGGPPPCREGEADGTTVEVLPILASEGHFLRRDEAIEWDGVGNVIGLYAVYQVSISAYSEENYPAGEYGLIFLAKDGEPGVVLHVTDGSIVRVDKIFDKAYFSKILQRDASKIILGPDS
jgi:hypothetical protein